MITDTPVHELGDVLQGTVPVDQALVPVSANLSILPTFSLDGVLKQYAETRLNDEPFIFEELVQEFSSLGFDLAIFDLSPGMSRLEKSVLLAMDEVVVPLTPEYFSVDGITIFNNELRKLNKNFRRSVRFDRIVCNAINHSFRRHREFVAALEDLDYELYLVPQDARLAESQIRHQAASEYDRRAKAIPELRRLAEALVSG